MDHAELTKIVIATVVGTVLKELLSAFIKRTTTAAATLKAKADAWLLKNPYRMYLIIDVLMLVSVVKFLWFTGDNSAVTTRRDVIYIAISASTFVWLCATTLSDLRDLRAYPRLQERLNALLKKIA